MQSARTVASLSTTSTLSLRNRSRKSLTSLMASSFIKSKCSASRRSSLATRSERQTCCVARWERRSPRSLQRSSSRSARECASGATPSLRSRRCGTPWCRSPTTPLTRHTRRHTECCRSGRRISRRTIPPSSWQRCSHPWGLTRTRWPFTWRNAAAWASLCFPRTSTTPRPTSRLLATTSALDCLPCATSAPMW